MFMKLGNDYKDSIEMLPVQPQPRDSELYMAILDYFGGWYLQRGEFFEC
jgi:hypothetical protein